MLPRIIRENKDVSDVAKKITLKETVWQKIFTYIIRKQ